MAKTIDDTDTIRDPRDGRRRMRLIQSINQLNSDRSAWRDHAGSISVYRSTDVPKSEYWIHDLDDESYGRFMVQCADQMSEDDGLLMLAQHDQRLRGKNQTGF